METSQRSILKAMGSGSSQTGAGCLWSTCLKRCIDVSLSAILQVFAAVPAVITEYRIAGPVLEMASSSPTDVVKLCIAHACPDICADLCKMQVAGGRIQKGCLQTSGTGVWAHHAAQKGAGADELVGRQMSTAIQSMSAEQNTPPTASFEGQPKEG